MNYRPVTADASDDFGWTPLHWAAQCGAQNSIKMLMAKHFEIDAADNYGRTPLIVALVNRHEAAAAQLLEGGATWKINIDGEEAWKWAFSNGHWSCGEFLLNLMNQKCDNMEMSLVRILYIPSDSIISRQRTIFRQDPFDPQAPRISEQPSAVTICELTNEGAQRPATACTLLRILERPYYHEIWVDKLNQKGTINTFSLETRECCSLRDRVERLFFHLLPEVKVTEQMILRVVRAPLENGLSSGELTGTLQLLLERTGNDFVVSRDLVEAAKNGTLGTAALSILLKREWQNVNFSTDILGEIMRLSRAHGLRTIRQFLEGQGEGFDVADELLIAVLKHEQDDQNGLKLLLNHRKKGVTAKTLSTVLQNATSREGGFGAMRGDEIGDNIRQLVYLHDMGEVFQIEGIDS